MVYIFPRHTPCQRHITEVEIGVAGPGTSQPLSLCSLAVSKSKKIATAVTAATDTFDTAGKE